MLGSGKNAPYIFTPPPRKPTSGPPKPGRPGGVKPPGMTVDQWARQQAEKYISAQVGAIEAQRQAYLDELARQSQMRVEQGNRLAQAMQAMGFDKRIQGIYSTVGSDVAGMAQGFSGNTRDIAAADAAQQQHMLSGTGQEGAVRNEGDAMGNVVYGVGGFLPGRSLGEQGAAFGADAALQPAFAMQQAASEAAQMQEEGLAGLTDFAKAIAEVKGTRMDVIEEMKGRRMETQNAEFERRFKMMEWQADQAYKQGMLALQMGDKKRAQQYFNLAARKQRAAELEAMGRDVNGKPLPGFKVGKNGQIVEVKKPGSTSGGLTANARQEAIEKVHSEDTAKAITDLATKKIREGAWTPSSGNKAARAKLARDLFARFSHLAPTPTAKKALKQVIARILAEAGAMGPAAPGASSGGGSGSVDDFLNS